MYWEKMTSGAIDAVDRKVPIILNLAAIEQHGPHLPVNTDVVIGAHFLSALDQIDPKAQLILPPVKVGCSAHHLDFDGTLSVPHRVMMDYVCSILDSVCGGGFRNILLFNSHGGNQGIGQVILEDFGAAHPDCRIAMVTWWTLARDALAELSKTGRFGTGHACEFETSLMMAAGAIEPNIDLPTGEFFVPSHGWADSSMLHKSVGALYRSIRQISGGSGVIGRPDAATLEQGHKITMAVVRRLETVVTDLRQMGQ
jgi:creatinine amidohydrolase|tara:strand:+ start:3480 stop:4244 length:765 start_codon:yes stop_codon:yes gene_type:complete